MSISGICGVMEAIIAYIGLQINEKYSRFYSLWSLTMHYRSSIRVSMNKLSNADRVRVISALVEGCSIRATVRMTGVAKNTIVKLLADIGFACADYHDKHVRNIKSRKIQCDEIWSFVGCKQTNVPAERKGQFGIGDVWTWVALDSDSKLCVSYMLGLRDAGYATDFMRDVASRLADRVQLTTDGHRAYLEAVEDAFGGEVDYAQLIKIYGAERAGEARYSPANVIGTKREQVCGTPEERSVSTSHVERQNLTMRMQMRRFTRLTNAFSKKADNLAHNIALHYMHYNFCRVHQTLRVTPAMEAGIADHVWELDELVNLVD
jgi:IS1 family transposase